MRLPLRSGRLSASTVIQNCYLFVNDNLLLGLLLVLSNSHNSEISDAFSSECRFFLSVSKLKQIYLSRAMEQDAVPRRPGMGAIDQIVPPRRPDHPVSRDVLP